MNFKTNLFATLVILPSLLFSAVELNKNNSCDTPYRISQLSGITEDVSYSDDYSNKHSKDIYLSFNTAVDGNFSLELLKDNDKKMKYQLFISNSCSSLNLVSKTKFDYTHNVNLPVVANRDYIIRIIKHSNGNSRYNIAYSFIAKGEEVIHGHTLPPKPDPIANSATLEGIDSNSNGVRDDVERAIYKKYDKKLHIVSLIDLAKELQQILIQPVENAKKIEKGISRNNDCEIYLGRIDSVIRQSGLESLRYIKGLILNNPERLRRYLDYNKALSGGNYSTTPSNWVKTSCSQEVQDVLEEMGQ